MCISARALARSPDDTHLFPLYRIIQPVRSAITAAYLLRTMAKKDGVEPSVKASMLDNADHFEEKAVGVMLVAQKSNRQLATVTLDCQLRLWTGMTLLDLAVKADCGTFVEKCCQEAIDSRMHGDINPYQTSYPMIFLHILFCLGVPSAYFGWIKFDLPPVDAIVRGSTQRRITPSGFPNRPHEHSMLMLIIDDPTPRKDMNNRQLDALWGPTFGAWERFLLFWQSPLVLYLCNTLISWVVTIVFTNQFIAASRLDKTNYQVSTEEVMIIIYHGCAIVREILQLATIGSGWDKLCEYWTDFWNVLDWAASILFFWGFAINNMQLSYVDLDIAWLKVQFFTTEAPFVWDFDTAESLYGTSIMLMYLKLLRSFAVYQRLGIIVKMFFAMMKDALRFLIMYILLLFAFSIFMVGIGNPSSVLDKCHGVDFEIADDAAPMGGARRLAYNTSVGGADTEDFAYVNCWKSWWFFRTVRISPRDPLPC